MAREIFSGSDDFLSGHLLIAICKLHMITAYSRADEWNTSIVFTIAWLRLGISQSNQLVLIQWIHNAMSNSHCGQHEIGKSESNLCVITPGLETL
jgi:hypothetical protein